VLNMRHFDVQLIGGMVLHDGRIAEMKTGEGKTLVATLPVYLNALSGRGVHVITVNDYLAKRDSEWMGKLYRFLGLSVGVIVHDLDDEQRREAYAADVTYGTNNEFGFDYLRDNMVHSPDEMVQRKHHYAMVDEVDSVLIDDARTPLIISGPCSAETEEQVMETATRLAATGKVDMLRAGIWKPRTRPGSFEGIGTKGLPWLQQARKKTGLPVTIEVATGKQVEDALHFDIDVLWIGARTTVNPFSVQEVADALRGVDVPVLIKNPINRYLINSPMLPNMKKDADGSLTLYIQKDSPGADKGSNWLPAPNDLIYLVMRLYWPKPEPPSILPAGEGTWKPPGIVKAK